MIRRRECPEEGDGNDNYTSPHQNQKPPDRGGYPYGGRRPPDRGEYPECRPPDRDVGPPDRGGYPGGGPPDRDGGPPDGGKGYPGGGPPNGGGGPPGPQGPPGSVRPIIVQTPQVTLDTSALENTFDTVGQSMMQLARAQDKTNRQLQQHITTRPSQLASP